MGLGLDSMDWQIHQGIVFNLNLPMLARRLFKLGNEDKKVTFYNIQANTMAYHLSICALLHCLLKQLQSQHAFFFEECIVYPTYLLQKMQTSQTFV